MHPRQVERAATSVTAPLRVLFALPGLHRVARGAEMVFERLGAELAQRQDCEVTLIGSGEPDPARPYAFRHAGCVRRERFVRWPRVPLLRGDAMYEELTFVPGLLRAYRPADHDVTVTCSYPYTNWVLRSRRRHGRPAHVFVTENGDWPARRTGSEFRWFSCDGLVCTNTDYYERHKDTWYSRLIPNGVDPARFTPVAPGPDAGITTGLSGERPVVLMVGALVPAKRPLEALEYLAAAGDVDVLFAGDGPLAGPVDALGRLALGDRYRRLAVTPQAMPDVYRAADVLLHMSLDEPFGNIYLEALATGLPVVAHDNPKSRWILEDQAELVDTTDAGAVAEGLARALTLDSSQDVDRRRELIARRYAWPVVAEAYLEFLREVAAGA